MKTRLAEERGFVIASLVRMIVLLLALGIVVVEGGSILFSRIALDDAANAAAVNAADQLDQSQSQQAAQAVAAQTLAERDSEAKVVRFEVLPDGFVRITVRKQAATIFVHRIGFLEDLAVVEAVATGGPGGLI